MKSSTKWNSVTRTLGLIYAVLTTFPVTSDTATTGGATLEWKWQYANPGSLLENGRTCDFLGDKRCDVYIEFCMREAFPIRPQPRDNCQVLERTTTIVDNVDQLSNSIERKDIPAPVTNYYTFEATIYDSDVLNTRQKIGDFIARSFELRPSSTFTLIPVMRKVDENYNKNMRLNVEARLACHTNYYGDRCDRHCKKTSKYVCDLHGNRICLPGYQGETCDFEDACYFELCADYAQCVNREDKPGRICQCNGGEGPECYPGYDPCQRNPCENNGNCSHTGTFNASFVCNCTFGWVGHRCTDKLTACKAAEIRLTDSELEGSKAVSASPGEAGNASVHRLSVCLNGGTCYDHADQFDYRCVCPLGWSGERCEVAMMPFTTTHLTLYMLLVAIPFCIALVVIIFILAYRYRRSRQVLRYMSKAGGIVYFNRNSDTLSINNGNDYQSHYIDHIYRDMKAGSSSITVKVADRTKSEQNTDSEVYDECNPLGLDSGSNPYGTVFDVDHHPPSIYQTSSISSGQEFAPPLPERPYPLSPSASVYHQSMLRSAGIDNSTYRSIERPDCEISPDYSTGSRKSRIYRPISPPVFIPGSALDKIESSPNM